MLLKGLMVIMSTDDFMKEIIKGKKGKRKVIQEDAGLAAFDLGNPAEVDIDEEDELDSSSEEH